MFEKQQVYISQYISQAEVWEQSLQLSLVAMRIWTKVLGSWLIFVIF